MITTADLLRETSHRPWQLPEQPWVMTQEWRYLLFAHWPLPPESIRPRIPPCFELDTFDGQAWLGVVPFLMTGVRFRALPPLPPTDRFLELNARTYVRYGDKAGVFFFSLDAASALAVAAARRWFHLPYYNAAMSLHRSAETITYYSHRTHRTAPVALFFGRYRPTGAIYTAQPGDLDHWLTERYCLYTTDRQGRPYRGEIHHPPWPLQRAEAEIKINAMTHGPNLSLPGTAPLLHYAHYLQVLIWPLVQLS